MKRRYLYDLFEFFGSFRLSKLLALSLVRENMEVCLFECVALAVKFNVKLESRIIISLDTLTCHKLCSYS